MKTITLILENLAKGPRRTCLIPLILVFAVKVLGPSHFVSAQPSSWVPQGIGGGGALFTPSISPYNSAEVFIGCDMTQIFHTTNSGLAWNVLDFNQLRFAQNRVEFTSDPNILYSVNHDFQPDLRVPSRSSDGGMTWSPLPNDPTNGETFYLYADGNGTNRLILTSYDEAFFSNDGGISFSSVYTNSENDAAYIAGVFWDSTNIFVGTSRGLLVSTNNGSTFSLDSIPGIPSSERIISFAGAKQGGTTRFFCVTLDATSVFPGWIGEYLPTVLPDYRGIYTLDYGVSSSWTLSTSGIPADAHFLFVSMAKNNIDVAYVAGGNVSTSYPAVYKTINGGANWQNVFFTSNNQNISTGWSGDGGDEPWWFGEVAHGFTVASDNPDIAIITDFGFAHITTDGGNTWQQMYVSPTDQNPPNVQTPRGKNYRSAGLENTSCWSIYWSDSSSIFVGFSDFTAIRSTDGGESWSKDYTGLNFNSVYYVLKHPTSDVLYAATSSVHDMYESTYLQDARIDPGTGQILYSTDTGKTWQTLHDFGHPVIWMASDPSDANTMYASVIHSTMGGIYVSNNIQNGASSTWTKVANPPRTEGHPFNVHVLNDGNLVCSYSGRRDAGGAFTNSSGVFVSTNGGSSWIDRSDAGMVYWTKDIVIDPYDATQNTWYASVHSGWGGPSIGLGGLYKSTDRGVSWTRISNLDRVVSCAISPINPDEMYVTTEADGLWYTNDLNSPSPPFSLVSSYPFQHPVRVFFNPFDQGEVWVTSFGNGLRVGDVSVTSREFVNETPATFALEQNYPNPFNPSTTIRYEISSRSQVVLKIFNMLGQEVATLVEEEKPAGRYEVRWDAAGYASGVYFYRVRAAEFIETRKLVLLK